MKTNHRRESRSAKVLGSSGYTTPAEIIIICSTLYYCILYIVLKCLGHLRFSMNFEVILLLQWMIYMCSWLCLRRFSLGCFDVFSIPFILLPIFVMTVQTCEFCYFSLGPDPGLICYSILTFQDSMLVILDVASFLVVLNGYTYKA
jgi:hypothetical protein